ncbi:TonB-dependent receptor [Asticcacaulis sp. AND118]|uniref:TonB-dependent receptor n=1 Tax=Asticcacaulis sp. AND118 TaxID=2840468 RepID=UPI001CFF59D5|nr:TonB-dependent receptor [Asticcacaulis sp. AND118]UDF03050.1 TonB-dependent receptor [Asticcacaulis sp. AND118]
MKTEARYSISRPALLVAASLLTLTAVAPAVAQDTTEAATTDGEATEVVVVGQRRALQSAQTIKKNADTIVDSITATDIGAFPDKSVAEALQRVPGVSVVRSAARNDVMHYSAEPSGVIIRGLPQVRSEFNGRDMFSATSGYGLSWSDISPEMMQKVDVYKNQSADLIEGGIAGSVDLVTRVPFDQKGQLISGTIEANYGDLSKEVKPSVSGLYSNRWDTELGEFGLLVNGAWSEVNTTSEAVTLPRMVEFDAGTYSSAINYIPSGIAFNDTLYERTRKGLSLAGQWQNNDRTMKATLQYNHSTYDETWSEDQLISYWMWVDPATTNHSTTWNDPTLLAPPVGGSPYVFGSDGLIQSGTITGSRGGWGYGLVDWNTLQYIPGSTDQYGTYARHGINQPLIVPCLNLTGMPCRAAPVLNTVTRYSNEVRTIDDVALNFIWTPTDRLRVNFDLQHVKATTEKYDVTFEFTTYADLKLDLRGEYPTLGFQAPSGYNVIGADPLSDYRNYSPESAMDHRTDSEGTLTAVRADLEYSFDTPWLQSIRAGVRYADRQQDHKWSLYNWGSISSDWGVNPADSFFIDSPATYNPDGSIKFQGYEPGYYENRDFGSDLMGGGLLGHNNFVFMKRDIISNPAELAKRFAISGQTDQGGTASSAWNPICERPDEVAGSCYTPGEQLSVSEEVNSAYVMLKFGGTEARLFDRFPVSGNVGVRYVETTIESVGALNFATPFTAGDLTCSPYTGPVVPGQYAITPGCLAANSLQDQAFSSGGSSPSVVSTKHKNTLPSFNLKVELNDTWIARFAASRAMSKPDIGLLRNFTTIQRSFLAQSDIRVGNPNLVLNSSGVPVSYNYSYSGATGNPRLKPVTADQFDLSFENYFASAGSFSFALFYKKFHDYIQNGVYTVPVTNNGVTRNVTVRGPVNGDGAAIKGWELAFTRYFDFLPSPWNGLGVQANYTKLNNSGVKNANLVVDTTGGDAVAASAQAGNITPARLENLSDDAYNFILMYEKSKFGARLAYNWRSEYISSINDCCVRFHVWNESEGFLDGSLRYAVNDRVELNLQASNLLGTEIRIRQQVKGPTEANPDQEMKFLPAGWFRYDRRIQLGVRIKY